MTEPTPDDLRATGRRNPARTLGIVAICIAAVIAGPVILYKLAYPDYSHRYRLTLAIEVDGKVYTGSSVIEVTYQGQPYIPGVGSYIPHVGGQAVFVDVARHGTMVAALHPGTIQNGSSSAASLAMQAYGTSGGYEAYRAIRHEKGRRDLAPNQMPLLVWFNDTTDPATARVIKVEEIPALLGPTARLVSAYLEMTNDRVVIDIDRRLPWFAELAKRQRQRGMISRPNEFQIGYSMFVGTASIHLLVDPRR